MDFTEKNLQVRCIFKKNSRILLDTLTLAQRDLTGIMWFYICVLLVNLKSIRNSDF